ncbi:hypothetical protein SNEBB_001305 [Seison nebaliae]|nr:hypothetical protein SNEBB_001305 [Seison nebaliae]
MSLISSEIVGHLFQVKEPKQISFDLMGTIIGDEDGNNPNSSSTQQHQQQQSLFLSQQLANIPNNNFTTNNNNNNNNNNDFMYNNNNNNNINNFITSNNNNNNFLSTNNNNTNFIQNNNNDNNNFTRNNNNNNHNLNENENNGLETEGIASALLYNTISIDTAHFTDAFLTCGTCFAAYDDNERSPKLLPCSHTVCRICLSRIIESEPRALFGTAVEFQCPHCRERVTVPRAGPASEGADAFPPSFLVNQLLDLIRARPVKADILARCTRHSDCDLLYCETCDLVFCSLCHTINKQRNMDDTYPNDQSPSIRRILNNNENLNNHQKNNQTTNLTNEILGSNPTTNDHQKFLSQTTHASHTVVPFSLAVKRLTDILQFKTNECRTQLDRAYKRIQDELTSLDRQSSLIRDRIDDAIRDVIELARRRKEQLHELVDGKKDAKRQILLDQLRLIQAERMVLDKDVAPVQRDPSFSSTPQHSSSDQSYQTTTTTTPTTTTTTITNNENFIEKKMNNEDVQRLDVKHITKVIHRVAQRLDVMNTLMQPRENYFMAFQHLKGLDSLQHSFASYGAISTSETVPSLCKFIYQGSLIAQKTDHHMIEQLISFNDSTNSPKIDNQINPTNIQMKHTICRNFNYEFKLFCVTYLGKMARYGGDPISIRCQFTSIENENHLFNYNQSHRFLQSNINSLQQQQQQQQQLRRDIQFSINTGINDIQLNCLDNDFITLYIHDKNDGSYDVHIRCKLLGKLTMQAEVFGRNIDNYFYEFDVKDDCEIGWQLTEKNEEKLHFPVAAAIDLMTSSIIVLDSGNQNLNFYDVNGNYSSKLSLNHFDVNNTIDIIIHKETLQNNNDNSNKSINLQLLNWKYCSLSNYRLLSTNTEWNRLLLQSTHHSISNNSSIGNLFSPKSNSNRYDHFDVKSIDTCATQYTELFSTTSTLPKNIEHLYGRVGKNMNNNNNNMSNSSSNSDESANLSPISNSTIGTTQFIDGTIKLNNHNMESMSKLIGSNEPMFVYSVPTPSIADEKMKRILVLDGDTSNICCYVSDQFSQFDGLYTTKNDSEIKENSEKYQLLWKIDVVKCIEDYLRELGTPSTDKHFHQSCKPTACCWRSPLAPNPSKSDDNNTSNNNLDNIPSNDTNESSNTNNSNNNNNNTVITELLNIRTSIPTIFVAYGADIYEISPPPDVHVLNHFNLRSSVSSVDSNLRRRVRRCLEVAPQRKMWKYRSLTLSTGQNRLIALKVLEKINSESINCKESKLNTIDGEIDDNHQISSQEQDLNKNNNNNTELEENDMSTQQLHWIQPENDLSSPVYTIEMRSKKIPSPSISSSSSSSIVNVDKKYRRNKKKSITKLKSVINSKMNKAQKILRKTHHSLEDENDQNDIISSDSWTLDSRTKDQTINTNTNKKSSTIMHNVIKKINSFNSEKNIERNKSTELSENDQTNEENIILSCSLPKSNRPLRPINHSIRKSLLMNEEKLKNYHSIDVIKEEEDHQIDHHHHQKEMIIPEKVIEKKSILKDNKSKNDYTSIIEVYDITQMSRYPPILIQVYGDKRFGDKFLKHPTSICTFSCMNEDHYSECFHTKNRLQLFGAKPLSILPPNPSHIIPDHRSSSTTNLSSIDTGVCCDDCEGIIQSSSSSNNENNDASKRKESCLETNQIKLENSLKLLTLAEYEKVKNIPCKYRQFTLNYIQEYLLIVDMASNDVYCLRLD